MPLNVKVLCLGRLKIEFIVFFYIFNKALRDNFIGLVQSKKQKRGVGGGASICAIGDASSIHSILMLLLLTDLIFEKFKKFSLTHV